MTGNSCEVTLSASGTEGATGYCTVQIGDSTYYTEQFEAVGTFKFTVKASTGTKITIASKWGTCADRTVGNTIANNGSITVGAAEPVNEASVDENNETADSKVETPSGSDPQQGGDVTPQTQENGGTSEQQATPDTAKDQQTTPSDISEKTNQETQTDSGTTQTP